MPRSEETRKDEVMMRCEQWALAKDVMQQLSVRRIRR